MADASAWIVTVPSAGSGVNRRAAVSLRTANSRGFQDSGLVDQDRTPLPVEIASGRRQRVDDPDAVGIPATAGIASVCEVAMRICFSAVRPSVSIVRRTDKVSPVWLVSRPAALRLSPAMAKRGRRAGR